MSPPVYDVPPVPRDLLPALDAKIDGKTKPPGSLGRLEDVARTVGLVQGTLEPTLSEPTLVVFAGDHGVTAEGVSAYPSEVTRQMVLNFLAGGAAINALAGVAGMSLQVVDAGVRGPRIDHPGLLDRRTGEGTRSFVDEPAMSEDECTRAERAAIDIVDGLHASGCNVLAVGEMGIGNTSAAALAMALALDLPLGECVGAGTGLDAAGVARKLAVLERARARIERGEPPRGFALLRECGGFESVMMGASMLAAAERRMLVLVDGFVATAALLGARQVAPAVVDYCVFAHCSQERGHRRMLEAIDARPLVDLGLRLGEGTGAALAYGLVRAAVAFLNEMASFADAGVSDRDGAG